MKRILMIALVFGLIVAACAPKAQETDANVLIVSDGTNTKTYTVNDLKALGEVQTTFKGVTYIGVTLTVLLKDAGIDPANLTAVKAVANDGFAANYDVSLFGKEDTIVAYATVDGPMNAEDGIFRMVLPNQEGKLNVRQLTEIIAIP